MAFKKAERKQVPLKVAITGLSGSGKTYSALEMAKGITGNGKGRTAVIDTENKSSSLYSDRFDFDVCNIDPPYTIDKYLEGIEDAIQEKYNILIIDSMSHAWAGEGGLLDKKSAIDERGGNHYANWKHVTKEQEEFVAKILHSDIHIIVTMRSKQEYALIEEGGKNVVKKLGMAPIQRDGVEYEFTTVFDLDMKHNAMVSKDRTSLFDNKIFMINKKTGKEIIDWLRTGKKIPEGNYDDMIRKMEVVKSEKELKVIGECINEYKWDADKYSLLREKYKEKMMKLLTYSAKAPVPKKPGDFGKSEKLLRSCSNITSLKKVYDSHQKLYEWNDDEAAKLEIIFDECAEAFKARIAS